MRFRVVKELCEEHPSLATLCESKVEGQLAEAGE